MGAWKLYWAGHVDLAGDMTRMVHTAVTAPGESTREEKDVGGCMTDPKLGLTNTVLAFLLIPAAVSSADLLGHGFNRISNNSVVDIASQLTVDIVGEGDHQVVFTFHNSGAVAGDAVIADIYFDDRTGLLQSLDEILDRDYDKTTYAGVDFSTPARPLNLPGANSIDPAFKVTESLSFDADNPGPKWGIGAGESLSIRFNVANSGLDDILRAIHTTDFTIGLHVQCLPSYTLDGEYRGTEAGDGFVTQTPLPDAAILGCSGLSLAAYWIKRRRGGLAGL